MADALGDALKKAKTKATIIAHATGTTGPVQVGGRVSEAAPIAARDTGSEAPPSSSEPGPACVLRLGDSGEVRVSGVALRTGAGNIVVEGTAEAWRLNPDARLFGGPLKIDAAYLSPQVPGRGPGWGSGIALTVGRHGWTAGPVLAIPPLTLWRLQLEPAAALTLGSGGEFVASGWVIGRWR